MNVFLAPPSQRRPLGTAPATMPRLWAVAILVLALLMSSVTPAFAYWTSSGTAAGEATTATLASPVGVTVPATADAIVSVSWTAGSGGIAPEGFYVTRTTGTVTTPACESGPANLITSPLACTDRDVAAGSYSYRVTAVFRSWKAVSAPSAIVEARGAQLLRAASSYSLLGTAVTNTGTSTFSGDVGVSPGTAVTGFTPEMVGGDIHAGDPAAATAFADFGLAYTKLADLTATVELSGDLIGRTLAPGVFHSAAALSLTGVLTLDAGNDPDAVFVIQVGNGAALTTAAATSVVLTNGARASNVFWVVGGAAGLGAASFFSGSILAAGAITVGDGTELIGRALSQGAITLAGNTIRFTAALPPSITITGGATATTKTSTPQIAGTSYAAENSPVTVTIGGQTLTTSMSAAGTWSVTATVLPAGTYPVVAKVRDSASNGAAATQNLTVQLNPPTIVLGTAASFSVFAKLSVVNTLATELSGDLGVDSGGTISGFPPGTHTGSSHAGDTVAATAKSDLDAAIADASARTPHTEFSGVLAGRTFHMGVHHSTAAMDLTGTVTLDAEGDPNAVFIFQTDGALTTAASSTVQLVNGAQASNVFWVVKGAAGTGASTTFKGTILASGAITLGVSTALDGRALSLDTVTLANNSLTGVVGTP